MAAVNGGINLLFMVFGMMLSLILASGVLSDVCLRGLSLTRRMPGTIHAGTAFLMGIAVKNDKKRTPTFSLEVEDLLGGQPVERRCYYLKLPAGRMQETAYKHTLSRRGRHAFSGFRISTRFPFGFIRKSRDIAAAAEVLVYPALVPVPEAIVRSGIADAGRRQVQSPSRSGDFHGLREYRSGDDPRDIHWRTSARRGRLFVRESEEETGHTVMVALDSQRRPEVPGGPDPAAAARAFEDAVSMAASLVVTLIRRGMQVGLRTAEVFVAPESGTAQATTILAALAVIEPSAHTATPPRAAANLNMATIRVTPGQPAPHIEVESAAAGARRTG
jgi:uncharacterized protein (DUF58 family)